MFCDINDVCNDGECVGETRICEDDLINCTIPICDEDNNQCSFDIDSCECPEGLDNECPDDGNICTNEKCTNYNCEIEYNTNSCDDDNTCTETDSCSLGVCSGTEIICDDGFDCTIDSCDVGLGCIYASDDSLCDDGEYCNGNEICNAGICEAGINIICDDLIDCTIDSCNEDIDDCENTPKDSLCDDGLFCNGDETCDSILDCQSGVPLVIDDSVSCTIDSCDEVNDEVVNTADDSLCLNGLWCDGDETCDSVLNCQTGTAPSIDDLISCTLDSCDEGSDLTDNIGTDEHDTSSCSCVVDLDCDDSNLCTDDSCNTALECENVNNDLNSCDDGFFCSVNDRCSIGSCISDLRDVDDSIGCTIDSCDEVNDLIVNTVDDGLCDDSVACTIDSCSDSLDCVFAPNNGLCDDSNKCTDDSCSLTGCEYLFNTNPCDDSILCTENDVCDSGSCIGSPNDLLCESFEWCVLEGGCTQTSCSSCLDCDTWFTGCSYDECKTQCQIGELCYYNGIVVGENCINLNDACVSVSICDDYNEYECVNDGCSVAPSINGCELEGSNCVDAPYCGDGSIDVGEDCSNCPIDVSCGDDFCDAGVCVECLTNEHCDDSKECTENVCGISGCEYPNLPLGTTCSVGECDGEGNCIVVNKEYNIWSFSDTHFDNSYTTYDWSTKFSERLDNMDSKYDTGLLLGDIVLWRNDLEEITEVNNILINKDLKEKIWAITGNHDTLHGSNDSLVLPYYLDNLSPTNTNNFTKTIGNILFIMIGDEGCYGDDGSMGLCDYSTYEWFNNLVSENQDKIIIVGSHEHLSIMSTWDACLPYSSDFESTLNNYNVDMWLYGHTHWFMNKIIEFPSGRKTIFVNDGAWECSSRGCSYDEQRSALLTFTENSDLVKLSEVVYDNPDDITPTINKIAEFILKDNFCETDGCNEITCSEDADCEIYEYTKTCDIANNKCVRCLDDGDCSFPLGACNLTENICIGCYDDSHCMDPLPGCDVEINECVECIDNNHCSEPLPTCDIEEKSCVECVEYTDCPGMALCDSSNSCVDVDCLIGGDCSENQVCWFDNMCQEMPCLENKDCEDFDDCSEDKCVGGYCEFTKMTNEGDCYYCADFSTCNLEMGINICGGADIDRNGSVGDEDVDILTLWWENTSCNESNNFCDYADINRILDSHGYRVFTNDLNLLIAHLDETCNLEPWRACELGITETEICDGFDNDCDGEIDEGNVCLEDIYCSSGELCNHGYCNSEGNCISVECGLTLNEPNITLNLGEDLVCNDYITLDAENVILDCRGFKIQKEFYESGIHWGISVTSNAKNMVIRNCEIINFSLGVRVYAKNIYGTIENNKIHNNKIHDKSAGIGEIAPSSKNNIRNNEFYNLNTGVGDDEGGFLNITSNKFHDCEMGISAGTRNTYLSEIIINNEFYDNELAITIGQGGGSTIKGNLIYNNTNGINLVMSATNNRYNNIIENNVLVNNLLNLNDEFQSKFGFEGYCDITSNCYENYFTNTTIDGKEVTHLIGVEDIEITGELGGLVCKNCRNIIIRNVIINSPNKIGILFYNSSDISFEGLNKIENQKTGIYLAKSHDVNIDAEFNSNELDIDSRDSYNNLCNGESCVRETCLKDADCETEKHYSATIPLYSYKRICENEKCVPECLNNNDCNGNPNENLCYHEGCIECLIHEDCLAEHNMCWWNNTCVTLTCENNLDCEDYNDCSEDVCVDGYCEFTEITDLSECYYCVDLGITRGYYSDYSMGRIFGGADFNHDGIFDETDSSEFYSFYPDFECDIENCPFCNYIDGSRNLIVGAVGYTGHEIPSPLSPTKFGTLCKIKGTGNKEECEFDIDACESDYNCPSEMPYCNLTSGKCLDCFVDEQCSGELDYCNTKNTCVECLEDNHCTNPEFPYCSTNYTCKNTDSCWTNKDCSGNEICWFNNTCIPIPCSENKDCEDFDDCSEDKCIEGYCEFTKMTNEEDCYYCSNFSSCGDNGAMNICGGADISHNGSVGNEDFNVLNDWWQTVLCNETNNFCDYADIDRKEQGSIFGKYGVSTNDLNLYITHLDETCNLEPWRACELGITETEICDGFDNDCDGEIDEECTTLYQQLDLSDNTLVLYNENSGDALDIAQYYANARGIESNHLCPIKLPTGQFATADQLLGVRKTIVENCFCNIIDDLTGACDISNIDEISEKSPITHLAIIRGIPPRLTETGWPTDSEEPSLDYYLSHMLYRNSDNIFTDDEDGRLTDINYFGGLLDNLDFQTSDSIGGYIRKIDPYFDRAVAYGRIEAITKEKTYELIDRAILAENHGVSGNFFRGIQRLFAYDAVTDDPVYVFFRELTSSLDNECIDYLNDIGSWDPDICRLGATNGEIPGEAISEIPKPINAGIYLGRVAESEINGIYNGHNAFDGFYNMLNWRKTNEDCIPLCEDTLDPENCKTNSKDYFKEINTDCVGVAEGFLGFQYRSWPVQYYGFWPTGWVHVSGGNGANEKTPPVILNELDNNYLRFGALDSVENPLCVLEDGSTEECKEMIGVNLRTYVYLNSEDYISISGEKSINIKFKHRNPIDSNARISFELYTFFTDGSSDASGDSVYFRENADAWVTENVIFDIDGDDKTIKYFRIDMRSILSYVPLDYVEFDDFELIDCDDSSCNTGINLMDIDTGSFNLQYNQTTAGDYASNVIDRLGGIAWWGSSSHFLTSGGAFRDTEKFAGAFYSGMSLGESLLYTNNGMSGIIYGDPLYRPSGVKIYVNDGLNKFNSEGINFDLSSADSFNIYINAMHGQDNIDTTQWQLATCHDDIEICDEFGTWNEIMADTGAKFGFDMGIQLLDLLQDPKIDQRVILRLRVWNPGAENNDLKNYGYFNYIGCLNDGDCTDTLAPFCHPDEKICVSCYDDTPCIEPTPSCNLGTYTCVECVANSYCTDPSKPFCIPDYTCRAEEYCFSDDDCSGNEICWFDNFCLERPCIENKDCEDFDDCSKDKCIDEYCEFTKITNEEDCYYCADFSTCGDNGAMNICGGPDINHNGSVGNEDLTILQAHWKNTSCNETNIFCDYADINREIDSSKGYRVYNYDLVILSEHLYETCNLEPWRACDLGIIETEICDGFDNDCDGEIDEECELLSLNIWNGIIDWIKELFVFRIINIQPSFIQI